ncbi:hypothetical protein BpHYR1_021874 [Brachionus plicatilis]|uniref:Uncharacterized protein n=1 Tax=Brachionus plicatilis TaxID=10195 RepID=A0A3M7T445_BRAPC|nr:hypothetical protein BpHYR1_021874 [Brachionus plicatilis]
MIKNVRVHFYKKENKIDHKKNFKFYSLILTFCDILFCLDYEKNIKSKFELLNTVNDYRNKLITSRNECDLTYHVFIIKEMIAKTLTI